MERRPEPELMEDPAQAHAYAAADFEDAHTRFMTAFGAKHPGPQRGHVLDLGCGPGDIACRFARAYPLCTVHGVDGSRAMLDAGETILARYPEVRHRVTLFEGFIPGAALPRERYDVIVSNSLLHHLHQPEVLWETVAARGVAGAPVFVMDLFRPPDEATALRLCDAYTEGEPEILKRDFLNSLRAAFEPDEVRAQLRAAGLGHLHVDVLSDRHLGVWGRV
jgi:SAM-dependent methyltransferase